MDLKRMKFPLQPTTFKMKLLVSLVQLEIIVQKVNLHRCSGSGVGHLWNLQKFSKRGTEPKVLKAGVAPA